MIGFGQPITREQPPELHLLPDGNPVSQSSAQSRYFRSHCSTFLPSLNMQVSCASWQIARHVRTAVPLVFDTGDLGTEAICRVFGSFTMMIAVNEQWWPESESSNIQDRGGIELHPGLAGDKAGQCQAIGCSSRGLLRKKGRGGLCRCCAISMIIAPQDLQNVTDRPELKEFTFCE